jgi:recombinational DNA repair protein (RecF pathway)
MSQEVKTRALLLQSYPFRERSRVLRLHTEHEGTLSVIALGQTAHIPPVGALLQVRLRLRPHRDLQRVAELDWDYLYRTLFHDPTRHPYLILAVEWLSRCLVAPDPSLFSWVRAQLIALDTSEKPREVVQRLFRDLLPRWGGPTLPPQATLSEIEAAYRLTFPEWRPLQSFSLLEKLTLPTYGA